MSVWWSIALTTAAVCNAWLLGNRWTPAWLLSLASQGVWLIYAVVSEQWGFAVSAVVFGVLNVRNYRKWRQLDREETARSEC